MTARHASDALLRPLALAAALCALSFVAPGLARADSPADATTPNYTQPASGVPADLYGTWYASESECLSALEASEQRADGLAQADGIPLQEVQTEQSCNWTVAFDPGNPQGALGAGGSWNNCAYWAYEADPAVMAGILQDVEYHNDGPEVLVRAAIEAGVPVSSTPAVGDLAIWPTAYGFDGYQSENGSHVAYVTAVLADGGIIVTEMGQNSDGIEDDGYGLTTVYGPDEVYNDDGAMAYESGGSGPSTGQTADPYSQVGLDNHMYFIGQLPPGWTGPNDGNGSGGNSGGSNTGSGGHAASPRLRVTLRLTGRRVLVRVTRRSGAAGHLKLVAGDGKGHASARPVRGQPGVYAFTPVQPGWWTVTVAFTPAHARWAAARASGRIRVR